MFSPRQLKLIQDELKAKANTLRQFPAQLALIPVYTIDEFQVDVIIAYLSSGES